MLNRAPDHRSRPGRRSNGETRIDAEVGPRKSGARGVLIVISGPSGAGKTSICDALLRQLPNTIWSISVTTRPKRPGDVDGQSYEFVGREEFTARERAGEFLETAEYVGHRYGTPRRPVEEAIAQGKNIILEIDVQGGIQVAGKMPDSIRVFVLPPNADSLRVRLEGRKSEAREQLLRRLEKADGEIAMARDSGCYGHFVVNDVLEMTVAEVRRIIEQSRRGPAAGSAATPNEKEEVT